MCRWVMVRNAAVVTVLLVAGVVLAAPDPSVRWRLRMDQAAGALGRLLPLAAAPHALEDETNRKQALADVETLSGLTHQMSKDQGPVKNDPSVDLLAASLGTDLQDAALALRAGRAQYARALILQLGTTCVACHSRTDQGAAFPTMQLSVKERRMSPYARAVMLAATRHVDQALQELRTLITDPNAPIQNGLEWDRAVGMALSLEVRVKQDPQRVMALANLVASHTGAPLFVRQSALAWRMSAQTWKGEAAEPARPTEAQMYTRALSQLEGALLARRTLGARGVAVDLLRASERLHRQLTLWPRGAHAADALHLLGVAYQDLEDLDTQMIYPLYFEACVHRAPHTAKAYLCFERYQEAMYRAYSGSGGYHPPVDVLQKLEALQKEAAEAKAR